MSEAPPDVADELYAAPPEEFVALRDARAKELRASGAYPWDRLLTHQLSLDELPAFFAKPPPGYLKAVVRP